MSVAGCCWSLLCWHARPRRTLTTAIVGSAEFSRPTASLSNALTVTLNDGTRHPQIGSALTRSTPQGAGAGPPAERAAGKWRRRRTL